ncbi:MULTISPECIES: hypothetical protein [Romboutsia]|jgi:hypothetical protein|uniref:hypothetical protein n=1 Tax=Romboutsia TaxID=1501226 RepID=UPI002170302F|nr:MULTISPECIES: hypothetical protein [Romboutsia]MCI9062401.1 hypothetical protein [Romboutsia sp.]MCI9259514.1 hypothetical protein [Romboutsia sp.]
MILEHKSIHNFKTNKKDISTILTFDGKLNKYQEEIILDLIKVLLETNKEKSTNLNKLKTNFIVDEIIYNTK